MSPEQQAAREAETEKHWAAICPFKSLYLPSHPTETVGVASRAAGLAQANPPATGENICEMAERWDVSQRIAEMWISKAVSWLHQVATDDFYASAAAKTLHWSWSRIDLPPRWQVMKEILEHLGYHEDHRGRFAGLQFRDEAQNPTYYENSDDWFRTPIERR